MNVDLDALIAQARARVADPPKETVNIVIGGDSDATLVPVEVQKLPGADWLDLEAKHPPRIGVEGDARIGSNVHAIPADYPVSHLRVAGQEIDVEKWREILSVIDAIHVENVTSLMWGLNRAASMMQVEALGKASAGAPRRKRKQPAN